MRQGSYTQYRQLFDEIANRHPQIMGFHTLDEGEIISGTLRSQISYPALLLEYPDIPFTDNKVNTQTAPVGGVSILMNVPKGDELALQEALDTCEGILLDVVSFLRQKSREGRSWHIDTNQLSLAKIGPHFADNCYGWRLEIRSTHWIDLSFKPAEWNAYDETKFAQ
jgi:hypothetical protein